VKTVGDEILSLIGLYCSLALLVLVAGLTILVFIGVAS
jgi:hypothetical protein